MKRIYRYLSCLLLFCQVVAVAQKKAPAPMVIKSIITDENGKPIPNATIYGNEGIAVSRTDASGQFTIAIPTLGDLLIEAPGFESAVFKPGDYSNQEKLTLTPSPFLFGQRDVINVAFSKIKKGNLVNAVSVLNTDELRQFDNTQSISSALTGLIPGMLGSSNVRGIGSPMFVVDGLPRDVSTLNLSEVAQISVLKDINSAILYGNDAVNGVVLVTTKRGQAYKKQINATAFYGISRPSALPEYLSSADYMELYNEARVNDGLSVQYSPAVIQNFRTGNTYRYPSVDYYSGDYLKKLRPFSRAMVDFSGGNNVATYYANAGWTQTGSLYNFGEGKSMKSNVFNVRGNIDLRISPWIKTALDAVFVLNDNAQPQGSFFANAATLRPNLYSPLIPISLIDPENALLKARKNDVDGTYLIGGTAAYLTSPIASGYAGGQNEQLQRVFSFNNRIDFDLSRSIPGLAFHTNLSFDFLTLYDQFISNSYAAYEPTWSDKEDRIVSLKKYGEDVRSGTQNVGNASYRRRIGFYGLLDYTNTVNDVHQITGSLLAYLTSDKTQSDIQGNKNANLGLRLGYGFKNKYLVDFSSAFVNSVKLPEGNRTAFSPSLGLAWVMSSEGFMSSLSFINYLKVRMSAGLLNSDNGISSFFNYDERYTTSGSYSWYEGTRSRTGVVAQNGGNANLAFEKRKELNIGFQSMLFGNRLSLDANVFTSLYFDQITRPQSIYPSYFSSFIPYQNFESSTYKGAELGLSYRENWGDFKLVVGANVLYADSKVKKRDELYASSNRNRTDQPVDARFGLVSEGFFNSRSDIDSHEPQAFGTIKPGDLKYKDQNGDGVIDANDEVRIGRWQAPWSYGLNLRLSYKNLTLFARGNGRMGADGELSNNYFWVDGDDKYSTFVLNRWTEATQATATFPRLSSIANTNNYRSSNFWLYRDNYFTIDRVQLTYSVPVELSNKLNMKGFSIFADASNLVMISKYRQFKELNIGTETQYRSYSLGLNISF
ncbi:SusC/RagA family TonB-linked outer membrane protein [Spirosoma aureum]|uniref:SusC/RagA family TonB-linked outer membrane protein n=1 Tax=Spirosoma aureum TaxID=2692134 RepID=A0A6G9AMI0_9BACT|nr:SusC/RagA family TonB-linked outer membrane protein [Spirosoma aureum]QIP13681.1 SusC/RagA family TonB-linked outer membrane protein [Spirosoma aureum]